jgi:hypothetical protein
MALNDYSSMEQEIRNTPEPKVLPKGKEVKARIIRVQIGISDKDAYSGARWIRFLVDIPDDLMVKEFGFFCWDPLTNKNIADPKIVSHNQDSFNRITKCFKIDLTKPFDWETDIVGKTGWIITGQKDDPEYGIQNTVSKFITGQGNVQAPGATATDDNEVPF